MPETVEVRLSTESDAKEIGEMVRRTLEISNSKDYPHNVIERIQGSFSTSAILNLMRKRVVFVAELNGRMIGTASLERDVVRTVFVDPSIQRNGVGTLLMQSVEHFARTRGDTNLRVPSSITAQSFYRCLGYEFVRETYFGDERTILMEKALV